MRIPSLMALFLGFGVVPTHAAEPVSFRHEVMPVLSRAGCNQGACHGNLNGKGGFKLSLRGEDPDLDRLTLTRDVLGRRIDLQQPEESLILRKATGTVAHEGGVRFGQDSSEYRILKRWIASGCSDDAPNLPTLKSLHVEPRRRILMAPETKVSISVRGTFSDGSTRTLNHLAVFEPTVANLVSISPQGEVERLQSGEVVLLVRYLDQQVPVELAFIPKRAPFAYSASDVQHPIDRVMYPQFQSLRLTPSPLASDSMFLRRVHLDVLGILPTVEETRAFLADSRPDKRDRLIDALVERPEFADFWAQKWSDLLRNEEKTLDRKGVRIFHRWMRESIANHKPLNEFAREVIAGRGSTYQHPNANFYRAIREPYARAEAVAQVFLGLRIQCAKCHNHPFDRWTQNDYHTFAAFFAPIDYRVLENNRRDRLDKHEFDGEQIVILNRDLTLKHPRTGTVLRPRLLGNPSPIPDAENDGLQLLAAWIAAKDNPYFARAQANRVWYHLLGRGLVEPNDDFRSTNPAVSEALLALLASELRDRDFDLQSLVRFITKSRTYQFSSAASPSNADDEVHFSRALIQPLEAEQLLDALSRVIGTPVKFNGYPLGTRAGELAAPQFARRGEPGKETAERFLKVFGKPERLLTCECERSDDAGMLQAFQLITGELIHQLLTAPDNHLSKLLAEKRSDADMVEWFYLAALSRAPTATEKKQLAAVLQNAKDRRGALEDVVWALVNSKEFLLRR